MQLTQEALRAGWFVCCLNNRGANGTPLHTPKTYCGSYTDDIRLAVHHIREMRGFSAPLLAAGFSLGANMLTKFVAEECRAASQHQPGHADAEMGAGAEIAAHLETTPRRRGYVPDGVVVVSNPWDFHEASRALRSVPAFDKVMAAGLVRQFSQHYRSVGWDDHPDLDAEVVLNQVSSVYDFDEQVTRRVWGYASVDAYYDDASSARYLGFIDTPLVAINALDDPLIPAAAIPFDQFSSNPHLLLVTTPCGGHVGFAEGMLPLGDVSTWAERLAIECLSHLSQLG